MRLQELVYKLCLQKSKGKPWIAQYIGIYDFKDFGYSQVFCYDAIQITYHLARSYESNYPELLRKGFIVNAPSSFQVLYNLLRPVLDEKTLGKMSVLGSDVDEWRQEISKLVPLSQVPKKYGGDADDDGACQMGIDSCGHHVQRPSSSS